MADKPHCSPPMGEENVRRENLKGRGQKEGAFLFAFVCLSRICPRELLRMSSQRQNGRGYCIQFCLIFLKLIRKRKTQNPVKTSRLTSIGI
jgi:hypothetical protein